MKRTLLGLGFAFAFSSIGFAQQSSGSSATGAGTGAPGGASRSGQTGQSGQAGRQGTSQAGKTTDQSATANQSNGEPKWGCKTKRGGESTWNREPRWDSDSTRGFGKPTLSHWTRPEQDRLYRGQRGRGSSSCSRHSIRDPRSHSERRNCPGNDCWGSAGQFTDAFADRNSDGNSWCESNRWSWDGAGGNACSHPEVDGVILTIILLRRDRRRGLRGSLGRGRIGGTAAALARTNARRPIAADRCGEGHQENAGKPFSYIRRTGLIPVTVLFFSEGEVARRALVSVRKRLSFAAQ